MQPKGPVYVAPPTAPLTAAEDIDRHTFIAVGPGGKAVTARAGTQPVGVSKIVIPKGGVVSFDPIAGNACTQNSRHVPLRLGAAATTGAHLCPNDDGHGVPGRVGIDPIGGRCQEGHPAGDLAPVEVDLLGVFTPAAA